MHELKTSFYLSLFACLLSLGTALTPWFTLSSRVSLPEVSRHDECLFQGVDWNCVNLRQETPAIDPGALSWQEIPAHYFYYHHRNEERPLWNPYIGSGYPIFLDGITRPTAPSRMFLSQFPTDGSRDFLIFFRFLFWAWGILFALSQLGVKGPFLFVCGVAATMLPMVARFVDIIFFDVDLMAPWILALAVPWLREKSLPKWHWFAYGFLGLWIGLQAFIQSQVIFCTVFGIFCLILIKKSKWQSAWALLVYAVPFFLVALPYALEFKNFFPELASNRPFLGCISNIGGGLANLWHDGYIGYLKNTELGTVFSVLGIPLILWGVRRNRALIPLLVLYGVLFFWMAFGTPSIVCGMDGLNAIHIGRHLTSYLQSLFLVLAAFSLWSLAPKLKFRKALLTLGFFVFIYPALNHNLISYRHLVGKYAKASEFHPEAIPDSNVYFNIQKLSQTQDRRHFAPDWRLYPNYSSIFEILDLRVLYGVFPKRMFILNDGLFHEWHETPSYGHADRFVGPELKLGFIPPDLEKLLVLHRVSLLSFSKTKNWIAKGQIYNENNCQKQKEDAVAVFYFCPFVGGVGYFPKEVNLVSNEAEALEVLKSKKADELLDVAIIEQMGTDPIGAAQGKIVSFRREPNVLIYKIEVSKPGVFVVADAYFKGWRAQVNGEEKLIYPANVAFKAVSVPTGEVEIRMEYHGK